MTRRIFLRFNAALGAAALLSGFSLFKINIRHYGKKFEYLKNPELRTKETGDALMVIENAEISGEDFGGRAWRNIHFKKCDFKGAYAIQLTELRDCLFEDCSFNGIINWGKCFDTTFRRCQYVGNSIVGDDYGSGSVLFEECTQTGTTSDPNHQGGFGSAGHATFVRCKTKWNNLWGYESMTLQFCELEWMDIDTSSIGDGGENFPWCTFTAENCKFHGSFYAAVGMAAGKFQSITLRDTTFDHLDLYNVSIKDDMLLERVTGGFLTIFIRSAAKSFTLRDSKIYDNSEVYKNRKTKRKELIDVPGGGFNRILMERAEFISKEEDAWAVIGGHNFIDADNKSQDQFAESVVIDHVKARNLRAINLRAKEFKIQNSEFFRAELDMSRLANLEITNTTISALIDLTDTKAAKQKIDLFSDSPRREEKLENSNVRLKHA